MVGQTIVEELFEWTNPIGETIRVRGLPLTVVGVLERKGMSLMGSVQDDIIIIPYSTAFQKVSGRSHAMVVNVQVFSASAMNIAQLKSADLLRERHRLWLLPRSKGLPTRPDRGPPTRVKERGSAVHPVAIGQGSTARRHLRPSALGVESSVGDRIPCQHL